MYHKRGVRRAVLILGAALLLSVLTAAVVSEATASIEGCTVHSSAVIDPPFAGYYPYKITVKDAVSGEIIANESGTEYFAATPTLRSASFNLKQLPPSGRVRILFYSGTFKYYSAELPVDNCYIPPDWWFSVEQQSTDTPESAVPNPAGALACGLFDVLGHGEKVVDLSLYPDCPTDPVVYCLDGAGQWTDSNILDPAISDDGFLSFTSSQDGLCGLFPAP